MTFLLPNDVDLRATVAALQCVQQDPTATCFNGGRPLNALARCRASYAGAVGTLNSQLTGSASRLTAGAYASATRNRPIARKPFAFRRARALFPVGMRGRDADGRPDGTLAIWTVAWRKRLAYRVPAACKSPLAAAKKIERVTVIERAGRLLGHVTLTLDAPEPQGIVPLGIDLNETNALVAVSPASATLCVSGRSVKMADQRAFTTRKCLQQNHAARKAEPQDTRSVRRDRKQLGRTRSNRTGTFAHAAAT
jgi:hypothetical protein